MAKGNFNKTHVPEIVWPKIFERICEGKSLTGALKELNPQPSLWWAKMAIRKDPELRKLYEEACEMRADYLVDELLDLVDAPIPEDLDSGARSAHVNLRRLQADSRKWVACKFHSRMYGDKLEVTGNTTISISAALTDANKRLADHRAVIEGEVVPALQTEQAARLEG